jgi:hypothetical protein
MPSVTAARKQKNPVVQPPPVLNRIGSSVKVTQADEPAKKGDIPIIQVEGDTMKRFNEAKARIKDAEDVIKELEPVVKQTAMQHIFTNNCREDCLNPLTSVKLQDLEVDEELPKNDPNRLKPGEITRVSFTAKYNSCNTEQVEMVIGGMKGRNVNEYVTETLAATFDDSVFLDGDGNFDKTIYNKFRVAIERVATELGLKNPDGTVNTPLKTKRVLVTKEDFHERRFKDFDVEENFLLAKVLPNTIQCAPVRTK